MRTEYTEKTISHTQDVALGYWDEVNEEWIKITTENTKEVAEILKTSPELLDALLMTFEDLLDNLSADLIDIWKRLNLIEKKLIGD